MLNQSHYLYYCLFNDDINSLYYTASKDKVSESWIEKDGDGSGRGQT